MADSTTDEDNSAVTDTGTDETASTDEQTLDTEDNLDASKSGDTTADEDNSAGGDDDSAQFDADLDDWAAKTGRKAPETDTERGLYQEIRDSQRQYSKSKQAKDNVDELDKVLKDAAPDTNDEDDDEDDPLAKDVKELKENLSRERATRIRSEYFSANEVTADEGKTMAAILKEKIERATSRSPREGQKAFEFWSHPDQLGDLHALAQARVSSGTSTTEIETEAARKERERIEKESNSSGPKRGASSTKTSDKTEEEQQLERFSTWAK